MTTLPPLLPERDGQPEVLTMAQPHDAERGHWYSPAFVRAYGAACAAAADERAEKYRAALVWALGAGEDFALRPEGRGQFWWRSELAERAGLFWNGERYLDRPTESKP